jgi:hypothetical protein
MALGAISVRSLTGTRLNRQYEGALAVADKQLSLIDYMGIDDFRQSGLTEGIVDDFKQQYSWQIETEFEELDNLYLVSLKVSWLENKRPHSIIVETRLNGTGKYLELEEEDAESDAAASSQG